MSYDDEISPLMSSLDEDAGPSDLNDEEFSEDFEEDELAISDDVI